MLRQIGAVVFIVSVIMVGKGTGAPPHETAKEKSWASQQTERLAEQLNKIALRCESNSNCFQFELAVTTPSPEKRRGVPRYSISSRSLTLYSPEGVPLFFMRRFGEPKIAVVDPSRRKWIAAPERELRLSNSWFMLDSLESLHVMATTPRFASFFFTNPHFDKIFEEIRSRTTSVTGDPVARMLTFSDKDGFTAKLHLTRERVPGQLPIRTLDIRWPDRTSVLLTNIYMARDDAPWDYLWTGVPLHQVPPCRREMRAWTSNEDLSGDEPLFEKRPVKEVLVKVSETVKRVLSGKKASQGELELGKALLARTAPVVGLSTRKKTELRGMLSLIFPSENWKTHAAIEQLAEPKGDKKSKQSIRRRVLGNLGNLTARVTGPIQIERPGAMQAPSEASGLYRSDPSAFASLGEGVPVYLAGHERWRTAQWFEIIAGPELAAETYKTLARVITDRKASREDRLLAFDLLGELGIHPASHVLSDIEASLHGEKDPLVRAMLASVRVRTGKFDTKDLGHLKKLADDTSSPSWLRWIALEGLMLADVADGQEALIDDVFEQVDMSRASLSARCLFASGCCKEGRAALAKVLAQKIENPLFEPALFLAQTSIGPGDPEWDGVVKIAKAVALDEGMPVDLRIKAAQIARCAKSDPGFEDRFIRSAFHSKNERLFEYMGALYLPFRSIGQRYLDEFENLLDHAPASWRKIAAGRLNRSLPLKLTAEEERKLIKLLRKMQTSKFREVRSCSLDIWRDFCRNAAKEPLENQEESSKRLWGDELTVGYLEMVRREKDAWWLAYLTMSLGWTLDKEEDLARLPALSCELGIEGLPFTSISTEQEKRHYEQHRDEIVAILTKWIEEQKGQRQKSPPPEGRR